MDREIILMGLIIHMTSHKMPTSYVKLPRAKTCFQQYFLPTEAAQYSKTLGVYDKQYVYKLGPIGYVALTHFTSRVRAVLVTVAILF